MKTLLVVMSELCNLNCTYCGVDKKSKKKIDVELFLNQYRKMRADFPNDKIKIDFFGGEPLLQFDIVKQIISETEHDPLIQYFMPTNGLVMTKEMAEYLTEKNVEISLSFDGLWQDQNRKQFTNNGTLIKFMLRKDLFRSIPNLRCHTMITNGNYNLLENHLFIKKLLGVNTELTLVRDNGIWDEESVAKLKDGIKELFDWYIDHPEEEMPFFILFYFRHMLMSKLKKERVDNCGAGDSLVTFNEDNNIVPCNRFKDQPDVIAKIPEYRLMSKCTTCEVREYCRKGCLYEQITNGGPIEELCDIYRFTYRQVGSMVERLESNKTFNALVMKELENG